MTFNLDIVRDTQERMHMHGMAVVGLEALGGAHWLAMQRAAAIAQKIGADWRLIEANHEVEFTPGTGRELPTVRAYAGDKSPSGPK